MKHILSADQYTRSDLLDFLDTARRMDGLLAQGSCDIARGKILATLFYEPSTRTRLSFETAMLRLGGQVISETDVKTSSNAKGESLADAIKVVSGYADIIALRSQQAGDAQKAAEASLVPVINAGDGSGQHPTQALLDVYTISQHFDLEKPFTVSFVGDLKYGRTVHSLCRLLRCFPAVTMHFVAPNHLQIPKSYKTHNDTCFSDITPEILSQSDVIYDTRLQKERFESAADYTQLQDSFVFDAQKVSQMKPNAILLHPLPRVGEILPEVDAFPQAQYFNQAHNGVPTRMALIAQLLDL